MQGSVNAPVKVSEILLRGGGAVLVASGVSASLLTHVAGLALVLGGASVLRQMQCIEDGGCIRVI